MKKTTRFYRFSRSSIFIAMAVICAVGVVAWLGADNWRASAQAEKPGVNADVQAATPTDTTSRDLDPHVLSQIVALEREKESRSPAQQKIDSRLLYKVKMQRREAIAEGVPVLESDLVVDERGFIAVDITGNVTKDLTDRLTGIGADLIAVVPQFHSVTARVPIGEVESLAALSDVVFIQPKQDGMTNGSVRPEGGYHGFSSSMFLGTPPSFGERAERVRNFLLSTLDQKVVSSGSLASQGDVTHRANIGRQLTSAAGAGLKIGVMSNGINSLATSQGTGDLPATVTVLPGQAGSGDEGTAMLELVYDTAPGAQLYYATAGTSLASFAQNIKDLRTAGCDIIIDDFSYFVETPFQNGQDPSVVSSTNAGLLVQAVNDVTVGSQAGALYFSSAANSGNKNDNTAGAWEGDFVDGGDTTAPLPTGTGSRVHSFGALNYNTMTLGGRTYLKWSDPLGGSSNDYDAYALDSTGTSIVASSTNIQNGTQDPSEDLGTRSTGQRIVVVKKSGAAARFLHINTNRGMLSNSTSGVIYGHNGGLNTMSVAATPAGPAIFSSLALGPFPSSHSGTNVVETFSSDGPRRIFYNADSSPITPGNVSSTGGQLLQKPDFTAADGISTTAPGFNPFFGTSAAAPMAGAITALVKSAKPSATNAQVIAALKSTAIDIETPGVDRDSGAGIIMPLMAMASLNVAGSPYLEQGTVTPTQVTGNSNGKIEPGETFDLAIQLKNIGLSAANSLSGTLTTTTPGVTITQGTQPYSNLAAATGVGTNATGYRIALSSGFACGQAISLTLTANYTGGPSVSTFTLNTGSQSNVSSTIDTTPPPTGPGFVSVTGTQTGRLNRNGVISTCAAPKATPVLQDSIAGRRYDAYTYTASAAGCVTVTIVPSNSTALYSAAYNGTYVPTAIMTNYIADYGVTTAGTITYSFNVTAGQQYVVVVHEITAGGGTGVNYTMNVDGPADGVCNVSPVIRSRADFDGDGRSDVSVFRSSDGNWYQNNSTAGFAAMHWGVNTDVIVPGDYDGDGKADFSVWRPSDTPGIADFYVLNSNGFTINGMSLGITTDVPVPGDFDGDGKSDFAVYRLSGGSVYWFIYNSSTGLTSTLQFGSTGDIPFSMDPDGDGKDNLSVYRPSDNTWYIARATGVPSVNFDAIKFGQANDIIVPADYDGDDKDDIAVFRPSNGVWYILRSSDGVLAYSQFGQNLDVPVPGDYDGDGKDDVAVFRGGTWYINRSTSGFTAQSFGVGTDVPVEAKYHP